MEHKVITFSIKTTFKFYRAGRERQNMGESKVTVRMEWEIFFLT